MPTTTYDDGNRFEKRREEILEKYKTSEAEIATKADNTTLLLVAFLMQILFIFIWGFGIWKMLQAAHTLFPAYVYLIPLAFVVWTSYEFYAGAKGNYYNDIKALEIYVVILYLGYLAYFAIFINGLNLTHVILISLPYLVMHILGWLLFAYNTRLMNIQTDFKDTHHKLADIKPTDASYVTDGFKEELKKATESYMRAIDSDLVGLDDSAEHHIREAEESMRNAIQHNDDEIFSIRRGSSGYNDFDELDRDVSELVILASEKLAIVQMNCELIKYRTNKKESLSIAAARQKGKSMLARAQKYRDTAPVIDDINVDLYGNPRMIQDVLDEYRLVLVIGEDVELTHISDVDNRDRIFDNAKKAFDYAEESSLNHNSIIRISICDGKPHYVAIFKSGNLKEM